MHAANILIIEDDAVLNEQLTSLMINQGCAVSQCFDGESGLAAALSNQHDLILLDAMLPQRDGFSVLSILRKTSDTPVVMVTARGAEEERIKGFCQGADDYLTKPFNPVELTLRVEAILRRCRSPATEPATTQQSMDGLSMDQARQSVTAMGQSLELTPIQFDLLYTLLLHRGEVLSKAFLYKAVLKRSYGQYDRSLDMHLSRVRRKLLAAGWPGERLRSVHGKGYCLT
jgi:DNA-binding response OmpR family regulator